MIQEKSQTTILIIIAIAIIAVIIGISFFNKQSSTSQEFFSETKISSELKPLQAHVIDCMEETSIESLFYTGLRGGYYTEPTNEENYAYLDDLQIFIPYYYINEKSLAPTKKQIEKEISKYIQEKIPECLNTFQSSETEVSHTKPRIKTSIKEDSVDIEISSKLKIKRSNTILNVELNQNPISIPSKLSDILSLSNYITNLHLENSNSICISCIGEKANEKDLYVNVFKLGMREKLFVISDNSTSNEIYAFEFLNKYPAQEGLQNEINILEEFEPELENE